MISTRALTIAGFAATLAACATPGTDAPASGGGPKEPTAAVSVPVAPEALATPAPASPALPQVATIPGPAKEGFIGRPVADLEELLGAPALVRREGATEFRRYDISVDCRAYVVARPGGGMVLSVETGAALQGAPKPRFEDCTAREAFIGS